MFKNRPIRYFIYNFRFFFNINNDFLFNINFTINILTDFNTT